jgi:hypothetical protein
LGRPTGVCIPNAISPNEPLKVVLSYRNFGRQPGTHFAIFDKTGFPEIDPHNLGAISVLSFWTDGSRFHPRTLCDDSEIRERGYSTIFPSDFPHTAEVGARNYNPILAIIGGKQEEIPIKDAVSAISTRVNLYVIYGCLRYRTFEHIELTTWCTYLNPASDPGVDITKWQFAMCPYGNETYEKDD